jgi:hypothetical protein
MQAPARQLPELSQAWHMRPQVLVVVMAVGSLLHYSALLQTLSVAVTPVFSVKFAAHAEHL